jgi:signal transduction histidine kinase
VGPFVRFVDLSPGAHRVEVAASLDAQLWSPSPAVVEFVVGAPWYRHPLFLGLVAIALAAFAYGVHRARVSSLLRLARQRARIARDLHDEMGSGLGSIGILAELAADQRLDESRRRTLSSQIAQTAGELGSTLDEIVWSLQPGVETLEALATELRTRGRRLFPDGRAEFRAEFPARWPEVRLSPDVRRQVLGIGLEAMHNAARHARARSVTLGLEPHDGLWRLSVEDDGAGIGAEATAERGHGRAGMRGRAEEIGARVAWDSPPGGGTVVTLDFDPGATALRREA